MFNRLTLSLGLTPAGLYIGFSGTNHEIDTSKNNGRGSLDR